MKKPILAAIAVFSLIAVLFAQETSEGTLTDAAIKALTADDNYESKLLLLKYAEVIMTNDQQAALETLSELASDGVLTVAHSKGRQMNDFSDIRMGACVLLGRIPTTESKDILIRTLYADTNVTVLTAAVRSLVAIGMNDNDDVIIAIIQTQYKNAMLYQTMPSNQLALVTLDAYEKLAPSVQNKTNMIQSLFSISTNYHYSNATRRRATQMLRSIIGIPLR
jgi:HEAT repeat protein